MSPLHHRLPATLKTPRLVMAAPGPAQVPAIARLCNNFNVHKWLSRLPFPYSEADARFFVEEIVPSPAEACYGLFAGDDLVGVTGLHFTPGQAPELGYWLGEPYWGLGYATEAGNALVAAARAAGFPALRSRALPANAASRHVLAKLGFVETGTAIEKDGNLKGRPMVLLSLDLTR